MRKAIRSWFVENPLLVSLVAVGLVAAHAIASIVWPSAAPAVLLSAPCPGTGAASLDQCAATFSAAVAQLALGSAGVASMVGGFAGVVVVFGLSSDDDRFRTVRLKASTSLRRNWSAVVTTPLLAAFGALVSAAAATTGATNVALWILEACVLLAAHGGMRLVIVLAELVRVVHKADEAWQKASDSRLQTDEFLGDTPGGGPTA